MKDRSQSRNKKKDKRKKRLAEKTRESRKTVLDPDALRRELSNPARLQKHIDRLESLLKSTPEFTPLRFSPEPLLAALDTIADDFGEMLESLDDPEAQRESILEKLLPGVLNRSFIKRIETVFTKYLKKQAAPSAVMAVGAGLFLIEIHRRQPETAHQNPLWHVIFDVSYREAQATSEGRVHDSSSDKERSGTVLPVDGMAGELDLSEESEAIVRDAVSLLESDTVSLGFSFDTILQGLRAIRSLPEGSGDDEIIAALRKTYLREIGDQERDDLIWGLDYAVDQVPRKKRTAFKTVLDAVELLTARDNPVMFALYYKCIIEFYRFLKKDEMEWAQAILEDIDSIDPILRYGNFLLKQEANKRSVKAFEAALRIETTSEAARLGAGLALWRTESFREARLLWNRAARHWSGYLPEDFMGITLCRRLENLQDHDTLPGEAFDFLYESCSVSSKISPEGKTGSSSDIL